MLQYCKKARALANFTPLLASVMGVSPEWLVARNLSGTHVWRKAGGAITEYLRWEEPDAVIVGDWADPGAAASGATNRAKGRKAASTRKQHYVDRATEHRQLEVRDRYLMAICTGLGAFGIANVTLDTTWREIFPTDPSPELAVFYGPASWAAAVAPPADPPAAPAPPAPKGRKRAVSFAADAGDLLAIASDVAPTAAALNRPRRNKSARAK